MRDSKLTWMSTNKVANLDIPFKKLQIYEFSDTKYKIAMYKMFIYLKLPG